MRAILALASVLCMARAAVDEVGFATPVNRGGCSFVSSVYMRSGNRVLFNGAEGVLDAASGNVTFNITSPNPLLPVRNATLRLVGTQALRFSLSDPACDVDLQVSLGKVMGLEGPPIDSYGLYRTSLDPTRSDAGYPCTTSGREAVMVTKGRMAAVDRFVGLFDPANNTATFVIDMIWVMTLEPGGGGASNLTQAVRDGPTGRDLCIFNAQVTDGKVLGVGLPGRRQLRV